jgi:hypothetical protein
MMDGAVMPELCRLPVADRTSFLISLRESLELAHKASEALDVSTVFLQRVQRLHWPLRKRSNRHRVVQQPVTAVVIASALGHARQQLLQRCVTWINNIVELHFGNLTAATDNAGPHVRRRWASPPPLIAHSATRVTVTGYTCAWIQAVHSQRRQNVPSHGSSYQRIIVGHCAPWLHVPAEHLRHSITFPFPSAEAAWPFALPDTNVPMSVRAVEARRAFITRNAKDVRFLDV